MNSAKKRRIDSEVLQNKVTIAPNDRTSNENTFDRSHPHLEGRWVGHIHLPLPSFDSLDVLVGEDQEGEPSALHDESQTSGDTTPAAVVDEQANGQSSSDESSSDSSEEEKDDMPQSRMFLPIARQLIHQWAKVLGECSFNGDEKHTSTSDSTVIVPLIPMDRATTSSKKDTSLKSKSSSDDQKEESTSEASHLHISLSRPIYLPTPSVDPFLSDIQKSLSAVINATNNPKRSVGHQSNGRIVNLQPQNALLLTNDTSTRTFLCIPISRSSSNWIKKSILPIVDSTMLKFGLLSYYNNEKEEKEENGKGKDGEGEGKDGKGREGNGCILHVSIASVYGNVIPQMLLNRNNNTTRYNNNCHDCGDVEKIRSIPLFFSSSEQEDTTREKMEGLSMPSYIPIRVDCIQCEFGKMKKLTIPL